MEHANEELNEVKDLYVTVCQSKEHLLESNEKLLQDRIEEKINEVCLLYCDYLFADIP